jgi:hypothetical protein
MVKALNDSEAGGGFWLPNIQRHFVWSEEQITKLFDSIMREYPISTLLIWRTRQPIKHRRFIDHWKQSLRVSDAFVTENVDPKSMVLDGQQRLQSLMIGIRGSYNGKELYFNITSGRTAAPDEIRYQFRFMDSAEANWPWFRLKDVLSELSKGRKLPMEVAKAYIAKAPSRLSSELEEQVQRNIGRAERELIHDENISFQLLDGVDDPDAYPIDDVVEIFIRANAGGTKLGKSDLLFSLLATEWKLAEEEMEELLEDLNKTGYGFDRDFVLKACLVMMDQGAKYEVKKFRDPGIRNRFVDEWECLSESIKAIRDFLHGKTFLRSNKAVPSYLGLIPLVYFRHKYPEKWETATGKQQYILRTMLTGAFSGTPDNLIDRCVKKIHEAGAFDIEELFQIIRADGRSLEVTPDSVLGIQYGSPFSHLIFNIWYQDFDYHPALDDNLPHQDHLFPQSLLIKERVKDNVTNRSRRKYGVIERDQIANLALLTARENGFQGKSDTPLADWLPAKVKEDPEFLKLHLIPDDQKLWGIDAYPAFIEARKKLILKRFEGYLQAATPATPSAQ